MLRTATTLLALALAALPGCGTNVFKSGETKDPAEDATLALEDQRPGDAISILESALESDEGNAQYLSILALAYAQRAGIEPLEFATKMASSSTSTSTPAAGTPTAGNYTALFALMPEASESNLTDIDKAVSILAIDIPADQRQPGDTFKLAIYQTASMILHTKAFDLNGDGSLTLDEILNLSDTSASGLLTQLVNAQAILAAAGTDDQAAKKAATALAKYQTQIDAADGATQEEKLKNYLAQNPSASDQAAAAAAAQQN